MSKHFIELEISKDDVRRETVLIAISAIQMVRADGPNKCAVFIGGKEYILPGVSYDDLKKKLETA